MKVNRRYRNRCCQLDFRLNLRANNGWKMNRFQEPTRLCNRFWLFFIMFMSRQALVNCCSVHFLFFIITELLRLPVKYCGVVSWRNPRFWIQRYHSPAITNTQGLRDKAKCYLTSMKEGLMIYGFVLFKKWKSECNIRPDVLFTFKTLVILTLPNFLSSVALGMVGRFTINPNTCSEIHLYKFIIAFSLFTSLDEDFNIVSVCWILQTMFLHYARC